MKTPVNTVFKSKMKTPFASFEDRRPKTKKLGIARKIRFSGGLKTIIKGSTLCTTCGEHIVHIDGVTGSSPVATTKNPWKSSISEDFLFMQMNHVSPHREKKRGSIQN